MKSTLVLTAVAIVAIPICRVYAQDQKPAAGTKAPAQSAGPAAGANADKAEKPTMKRVTGIGGVFIKAKDPAKLCAWYKTHLGIDVQAWGGTSFRWVDEAGAPVKGTTAWSIQDGSYFAPSTAPFMINYRVADLRGLMKVLHEEGCQVVDKVEESEFGIFGWVMDPEGNKVELWQPPLGH